MNGHIEGKVLKSREENGMRIIERVELTGVVLGGQDDLVSGPYLDKLQQEQTDRAIIAVIAAMDAAAPIPKYGVFTNMEKFVYELNAYLKDRDNNLGRVYGVRTYE